MSRAPWTYEQPAGGRGAEGLEDYVAYAADGEPVGKVTSLLRGNGDLYLVVDRGSPPFTHDRRAVPWEHVGRVDHDALGVVLSLAPEDLDRVPQLDPDLAVEPDSAHESAPAALRAAELPDEVHPGRVSPEARGPRDRSFLYAAVLGLGLFAVLGTLGVIALITVDGGDLVPFFLVPIALGAAALALGYRLWRRPYEGPPETRGRRDPR